MPESGILAPALADALVFSRIKLTAIELGPKSFVVRATNIIRIDKHAVVLTLDLPKAVAQGIAEVLIRRKNGPFLIELDDSKRPVEARKHR